MADVVLSTQSVPLGCVCTALFAVRITDNAWVRDDRLGASSLSHVRTAHATLAAPLPWGCCIPHPNDRPTLL